ncbi:MAG: DUF456 domain-containing protein [Planctomyces sp.]|nr:DUF456 domain-containing protein [Planctomyces sp.]
MWWYWTAATLLVLVNGCAVLANLLMLPGNWVMVGSLTLFVLGTDAGVGPTWTTVLIVAGLAAFGEVLEMVTGSAKASKKGASRRAMLLSFGLSIAGSIGGAFLVPIPFVGSAIGAVSGAALGAFWGAWLGEAWKGTDTTKRNEIGTAAMVGRILGMFAKLIVGISIFVFQCISLWM